MASWSGVYCVDPGGRDDGKRESGALSFMNPNIASAMYLDAANANLSGAYGNQVRHLYMEPGQLVLFPSWIMHDVKPFQGDGERITVAFNCWFTLEEPARPTS
jgi:hypothetical protein